MIAVFTRQEYLSVFPDLRAHLQGRNVMLSFNDDIGDALKKACYHNSDNDAMHLAQAAKVESSMGLTEESLYQNHYLPYPNIKHQTQHFTAPTTKAPPRNHAAWRIYHQQRIPLYSISNVQVIKQTAGTKPCVQIHVLF